MMRTGEGQAPAMSHSWICKTRWSAKCKSIRLCSQKVTDVHATSQEIAIHTDEFKNWCPAKANYAVNKLCVDAPVYNQPNYNTKIVF